MSYIIIPTDDFNCVSRAVVYDIEESIMASGYPMRTSLDWIPDNRDIERCQKLVNATKDGNGAHGQFMTGIRASFDLTCTNKMWIEAERYRFFEFVSLIYWACITAM